MDYSSARSKAFSSLCRKRAHREGRGLHQDTMNLVLDAQLENSGIDNKNDRRSLWIADVIIKPFDSGTAALATCISDHVEF